MIDNQIEKGLSDPILIFSDQVRHYYANYVNKFFPVKSIVHKIVSDLMEKIRFLAETETLNI